MYWYTFGYSVFPFFQKTCNVEFVSQQNFGSCIWNPAFQNEMFCLLFFIQRSTERRVITNIKTENGKNRGIHSLLKVGQGKRGQHLTRQWLLATFKFSRWRKVGRKIGMLTDTSTVLCATLFYLVALSCLSFFYFTDTIKIIILNEEIITHWYVKVQQLVHGYTVLGLTEGFPPS